MGFGNIGICALLVMASSFGSSTTLRQVGLDFYELSAQAIEPSAARAIAQGTTLLRLSRYTACDIVLKRVQSFMSEGNTNSNHAQQLMLHTHVA